MTCGRSVTSTVKCAVRLMMRNARPIGAGRTRFIDACYANQGPSQKRIRPAPMGRAFRVVKRTAHLTVRVAEKPSKVTAGSPGEGAAKRPRRATPKSKTSPKRPKAAKAGATSAKKKTTAKSRATAATE
jgi:large subunit ribosomal protein L22